MWVLSSECCADGTSNQLSWDSSLKDLQRMIYGVFRPVALDQIWYRTDAEKQER